MAEREPEAESGKDPEADPAVEHQPAVPPAPRARRRGRTALIVATAAVLGIVAGTATGYAIQADREPTPLPVLAQPGGVPYPAKPLAASGGAGDAAGAKAAVEPPGVVRDLRKRLIGRPAGSRDHSPEVISDGWMSVASYAQYFSSPDHAFGWLIANDVRRIAATSWLEGENRQVDVVLAQFRPGESTPVLDDVDAETSRDYTDEMSSGPVSGSVRGGYYLFEPVQKPGFLPGYHALGYAGRGDVKVQVYIFDTRPIAERDIRKLTERQLERL